MQSDWSSDHMYSTLIRMTDAILHRGPNERGLWIDVDNNIALGHRRLSIQDLTTAGNQPMHSSDDRFVIAFNGEVYNFLEIKFQLEKIGHQFRGHSDTEILLAAISEYGLENALKICIGMFALVLWDKKERVLHLCRDRIGEKPLFYGWIEGAFVFASELKALVEFSPSIKLSINRDAVASYVRFGYVPTPYAIYEDVYKVMPGTILSLNLSSSPFAFKDKFPPTDISKYTHYWSLDTVVESGLNNQICDESKIVCDLKDKLFETVERQIIADVPIGTFLSGGIDSTLVTAIAAQVSKRKVSTYTIGFKDPQFNEAEFAADIAKHLGTNHQELYLDEKNALDTIPQLASIYDEPFADASQIPMYLVSQFAAKHVTVCLSGDGGDELFAGYNRYTWPPKIEKLTRSIPKPLLSFVGKSICNIPDSCINSAYEGFTKLFQSESSKQANFDLKLRKFARFCTDGDSADYYRYLLSFWEHPNEIIYQGEELNCSLDRRPPRSIDKSFIEKAQYWDQLGYLVDDNLVKVDRASMAVSVECRAPLLDHEILEFSWKIPAHLKVNQGKTKWPLRKLLYEYVPEALVERPKMGFSVPIGTWLKRDLRDWAESLLTVENLERDGLFNSKVVRRCWTDHLQGKRNHANQLWTVLTYIAWDQHYRR